MALENTSLMHLNKLLRKLHSKALLSLICQSWNQKLQQLQHHHNSFLKQNTNKETSSNIINKHFALNVAGFGDINVQPSPSATPSGSVNKRKPVFVCELCGWHIESKPKLQNHIDHHVGNPYKCQRCGKLFYYIHHFNKHMIDKTQ